MIVCKFGGSCTANSLPIKNISKLKRRNNKRKVFVFSAIGKSDTSDKKVTDLLISLCHTTAHSDEYSHVKSLVIEKFENLIKLTKVDFDFLSEFEKAEKEFLETRDNEFLISRGEYLTTLIMAKYLNIHFAPAEETIFFNGDLIDEEKTRTHLQRFLKAHHKIAIPGFYGVDENGKIKLFSRGGGDFSGALISKLLNAETYENWTDVEGVFEVNPSITKSKTIKKLSYQQLSVMTGMDTKVVHKDCAGLLSDTKTKMKIRSCFSLSKNFTLVDHSPSKPTKFICYEILSDKAKILIQNGHETKIIFVDPQCVEETIKSQYKLLSS